MSGTDFDSHFEAMGLSSLAPDVSCEATFAPGGNDTTIASQPRAAVAPLAAALAGTMPRLVLATPDAAREPTDDDAELLPVSVLGEGGMGRVLLARQHSLGREVAVKVLKSNAINDGAARALVEEARTTGTLEHPGVVPIYALARDGAGLPALVMKRVDGVSWRALIQDPTHPAWVNVAAGRDQLEAHLEVLIQVCNAVAYAHRRGVIHRDLKPANVLVGELGEVYVADWGVAIQKAGLRPGPPRLIGTPAYLAPEMVTGDALRMDERTDVYLLGATLHEVLTRAPPHLGTGLREVLETAFRGAPPVFGPDVPPELGQLCARAMAAEPARRFSTAVELRDAVRLFLVHRGSARLSEAAAARLKALEAQPDLEPRRWYALVSECRFGFASALETNPGDPIAVKGLERCLTVAAQTELDRGLAASARAFLSELKAPPPELEARLQQLEAKERDRAAREAKLTQLEHDHNPGVGARQRVAVLLVMAVATAVIVAAIGAHALPGWGRVLPIAALTVVLTIAIAVNRKALLSTKLNRQLTGMLWTAALMVALNRVAAVLTHVPIEAEMVSDAIILATLLSGCGIVIHAWFLLPALLVLAGAGVGLVAPALAIPGFIGGSVSAIIATALLHPLWTKVSRGSGAPTAPGSSSSPR